MQNERLKRSYLNENIENIENIENVKEKAMKKAIALFFAILFLFSCNPIAIAEHTNDEKYLDKSDIKSFFETLDITSDYSDLYLCYSSIENLSQNKEEYDDIRNTLMDWMINGKWVDESNNRITHYSYYTDLDNSNLHTRISYNLPTSQENGHQYYYYKTATDDGFVIGFEDQLFEDKKDNFIINFYASYITVNSLIENKTYTLQRDIEYIPPAIKDNFKNALLYITNVINNYYNPKSLVINWCYWDSESKTCTINVTGTNGFGGTITKTQEIIHAESLGYFSLDLNDTDSNNAKNKSNVDTKSLNKKVQAYLSNK